MVEQEMELDGTLGLTVRGPVKERDTQFDEGGIETEELILEAELLLSRGDHPAPSREADRRPSHRVSRISSHWHRRGWNEREPDQSQMLELPETACETARDLPQGASLAQLAEEHGHKLVPARRSLLLLFSAVSLSPPE